MKTRKKRYIKKPYTIFKTGNIIICTRIPITRHIATKRKIYGGESDNEYLQQEIFVNLKSILSKGPLREYLESLKTTSQKAELMKFVFQQQSNRDFDDFFDKMKKRQLNMRDYKTVNDHENKLYVLLNEKVNMKKTVNELIADIEKRPIDKKTKEAVINTLENGASMSVHSVSSSVMNAIKSASISLVNFFTPVTSGTSKPNKKETNVEILFFDPEYTTYRKGDSIAPEKDDTVFGDFMVINRPTKYSNTLQYGSEMLGSVEDVLTRIAISGENLLCIGNSDKCKKYSVKRKPYMHRVMRIVNEYPQIPA